jgi:POT family proton-dependent oligopeptide transporter
VRPRDKAILAVLLGGLFLAVGLPLAGVVRLNPVILAQGTKWVILTVAVVYFACVFCLFDLDPAEKKRVVVIVVLFLAAAMFFSGFEQAGSSFNLFAERYTRRMLFGREFPAAWFQSLGPVFVITLAPLMAALWPLLARRRLEPSLPVKFSLGLILLGAGFLVMAAASVLVARGRMVGVGWLSMTYLIHTLGELCLSPVGLSSVTKLAPRRLVGQMMGTWFLAASFGNLIAGQIAGDFNADAVGEFPRRYLGIVLTTAGTGLVLLLFTKPVKRLMAGIH